MNCVCAIFLTFAVVFVSSDVHIANDNYFLERVKRDATDCGYGMNQTIRSILDGTLGSGKTWNCSLEQEASVVVQECLTDNGGLNNSTLKLTYTNSNNLTSDEILIQNTVGITVASQSISVEALTIGCSSASCDSRVDLLCIYQ
ncbi:unnamed protein product [Caenorhabditis angaria]|uniref:C6 domain-containing protein n=1 Tax=Caenorhabditis angaria TaxID=860376 RepID=A0A9P1J5E8_9PELO|nr:unnamed protein product [Caenorhabditis angaria]